MHYRCKWFKTKPEALSFARTNGGATYSYAKHSRTREDHRIASLMFGFDPDEYPYSVNWNETVSER